MDRILAYGSIFASVRRVLVMNCSYTSVQQGNNDINRSWVKRKNTYKDAEMILIPIGVRSHWLVADIRPKMNNGNGVLKIFDSQNRMEKKDIPGLVEMLIKVGFLTERAEIRRAVCNPSQTNYKDCCVYTCAYIRNKLHGLTHWMCNENSLKERRDIFESIYLNRDVKVPLPPEPKKIFESIHMDPRPYCNTCDLYFKNEDRHKLHSKNLHSGSKRCRVCDEKIRMLLVTEHKVECKKAELKRIYMIQDSEHLPGICIWESNLYKGNRDAITIPCEILKPCTLYNNMTMKEFVLLNTRQQDQDTLNAKMVRVSDWKERLQNQESPKGKRLCKPCTASQFNAPTFSTQYRIYTHKHYSSKATRLAKATEGPLYFCETCGR